jgi:glutaredoxin
MTRLGWPHQAPQGLPRSVRSVCSRLSCLGFIALAGVILAPAGCDRSSSEQPPDAADPQLPAAALPPLVLTDDTPNLLLTWIDERGDFRVVQKTTEVPEAARKPVRVVLTDREAGTGQVVYVADLEKKNPDGSYPVQTMNRSEWDELGASKRRARLEALLPKAPPPDPADAGERGPQANKKNLRTGPLVVIIYGAEWCKPCHDAADYLKRRGVKVVEKNIETSEVAHREMRSKLERANMPSASIPIIDVMGQILVGFSPRALDRAIEAAKNTKSL